MARRRNQVRPPAGNGPGARGASRQVPAATGPAPEDRSRELAAPSATERHRPAPAATVESPPATLDPKATPSPRYLPPGTPDSLRRGLAALDRLASTPGGSLLVLRAFLGVTFAFAGLQKLANRHFFENGYPGSFEQQLLASVLTSPIHRLLAVITHAPTFFGVVISLGEVAVGLGTLLGLFSRIAALGGMLLALSFFLTVSFNTSPYYYGADIVFLFAWTPLAIGGSPAWSLDAVLARRFADERRAASHRHGARDGRLPVARENELARRRFLAQAGAAGATGAFALALSGIVAAIGRLVPASGKQPGSSVGSLKGSTKGGSGAGGGAAAKGTRIGLASQVPVGGAATFTDPAQGVPAYVVQPTKGQFVAFSAVCTHAGCTVQFDQAQTAFVCPCHGSAYNATTGAVIQGPSVTPLPRIAVAESASGALYVDG